LYQNDWDSKKQDLPFNFYTLLNNGRQNQSLGSESASIEHYNQGSSVNGSKKPRGEDMVINALQSQIDSLTSTVALLMDKFDAVEHRSLLAEQRVQQLMDLKDP
jgi:hypothetical protein